MSIDGTSESNLISNGESNQHHTPSRTGAWIRILIYLLVVVLVALVGWRIYSNHKKAAATSAQQADALRSRPTPVQVAPVEQKPTPIYLTAIGTVTPYMSVTIKARVNGELLPVKFTEGQEVRQGETIMVIDPKPYKAALDQAKGNLAHDEALLKNAKVEVDRYTALYNAGVVSKETLDTDVAAHGQYLGAIEADKAAVQTAQLQLDWCYIHAPISGKIGLRLVDPGNIITANTTDLVIINQFKPIAVYFTVPESKLPDVLHKLATEKHIPVEAYDRNDTQRIAVGQLLTADNQIDTTTGTARLKAVFSNADGQLYPNQFVNIHLVLENRNNAILVPSAAIQSGTQGSFVWALAKDEKGTDVVKMQLVKIALAEGQATILDSGVDAGQQVVVDGADRLRPNQPVTVSQAHSHGGGHKGDQNQGNNAPNSRASGTGQNPAENPPAPFMQNQGQQQVSPAGNGNGNSHPHGQGNGNGSGHKEQQ